MSPTMQRQREVTTRSPWFSRRYSATRREAVVSARDMISASAWYPIWFSWSSIPKREDGRLWILGSATKVPFPGTR